MRRRRVVLSLLLAGLCGRLPAQHEQALQWFQESRYPEAQEALEAAVRIHPDDARAHHYLGRLAQLRQDLPLAVQHHRRAAELRPDDADVQFHLAVAALALAQARGLSLKVFGLAREGRRALERAVALEPEALQYRHALVEYYAQAPRWLGGSMPRAWEEAEALRARDRVQGTLALAGLHERAEDYDQALERWRETLVHEPHDRLALFHFGRIAALSGRQVEAGISAVEHCLTLQAGAEGPRPAQVWALLGQLRELTGEHDSARAAFREAAALDPENPAYREAASRLDQRP